MSILLTNLVKRFGDSVVVDHVSLEIAERELFVLLGASGSGKSTVLRLVAGLLLPDEGEIALHGRDVTYHPPQERGIGFVFQNYSIFRHMNVADNVEFGLKIRGMPVDVRRDKREKLLDLVGLAGLGRRFAHQLSGGQQQRVALARALAYEPAVLLLDEPFSALDVKIRAQLRQTLLRIQRELRVTTILVTHDQEEAFELADHIGVMERGRLLETGTPEEIYYHPRTPFAATFVGAGGVLVGRVEQGAATFGPIQLPIPPHLPHEDGLPVQILVRPEQVTLSSQPPSESDLLSLGQGRIVRRNFTGGTRRIWLQLPHLKGTRQLSPRRPFGENELLLEAVVPATAPLLPEKVWVSWLGWHILEQPRLHLLAYDADDESLALFLFTRHLQEAFNAAVTVPVIAATADELPARRHRAQQRATTTHLARVEWETHVGDEAPLMVKIQASQWYDFILLPLVAGRPLSPVIMNLLTMSDIPLLLVPQVRPTIRRLLICTRAGEPGKKDIDVGGRLARRFGATVTLLHVLTESSDALHALRLRHLEDGVRSLKGFDVEVTGDFRISSSPAAAIVTVSEEGDYDLVVIGHHGPDPEGLWGEANVMLQVLTQTTRPVLVVSTR